MRSLSIAATGMMAQQLNVEVISNNLANMTTSGYKRRRAEFQDLLYQRQRTRPGGPSPAYADLGVAVQPRTSQPCWMFARVFCVDCGRVPS